MLPWSPSSWCVARVVPKWNAWLETFAAGADSDMRNSVSHASAKLQQVCGLIETLVSHWWLHTMLRVPIPWKAWHNWCLGFLHMVLAKICTFIIISSSGNWIGCLALFCNFWKPPNCVGVLACDDAKESMWSHAVLQMKSTPQVQRQCISKGGSIFQRHSLDTF